MSSRHVRSLFLAAPFLCATASAQSPYAAAFTSDVDYEKTFFVTPNADPGMFGPVALNMVGGGAALPGGGQWTKVGLVASLWYSQHTDGKTNDFKYDLWSSTPPATAGNFTMQEVFSLPLPPDVTDIKDLPDIVRFGPDLIQGTSDDLGAWATTSKMPSPIAVLEWARYLDLPVSVQLLSTVSQSGVIEYMPGDDIFDLDRAFERGDLGPTPSTQQTRRSQCMWDVSNVTDPIDDDPGTADPQAPGYPFDFASVSLADPAIVQELTGLSASVGHRAYVRRNLFDAVSQFLLIASDPRYAGHVVAFAIDPEVHYPAHLSGAVPTNPPLASHPSYGGGAPAHRAFIEDYNPAMCLQFARYEQARYGDTTPLADDNGDGKYFAADFGSDYVTSGWPGINAHSGVPATWDLIDPPRLYPELVSSTRTPYWHEWINFRVSVLDGYVQDLVSTVADAGVPAGRVFTHQVLAGSSVSSTRAGQSLDPTSPFHNSEWLDDWVTMEVSRGSMGSSIYSWGGVNCDDFFLDNVRARGDWWGAPEYNPSVTGCQGVPNCVQPAVDGAFDAGARILWPHAWDAPSEPLFSYRYAWNFTNSLNSSWTTAKMTPAYLDVMDASSPDASYTLLNTPIDATLARYLSILTASWDVTLNPHNEKVVDLRVDFLKQGVWHTETQKVLRTYTLDYRWFTIDLGANPNWTGTIDGLRVYVAPSPISQFKVARIVLPVSNEMTTALKSTLTAKSGVVRPKFPASSLSVTTPLALTTLVSPTQCDQGDGRVTVYGTDPTVGPICTGGMASPTFGDFCVAGNFEPQFATQVPNSGIQCGGSRHTGLRSPAATYLGLHKTGKFHSLLLPNVTDLHLSFRTGIEDTAAAGGDGVRFRVLLRAADGELFTIFDREQRTRDWSPLQLVSLDAWRGQVVDLAFEVHGISNTTGDKSAWGEPRIVRTVTIYTAVHGYGVVVQSPKFVAIQNERAAIQAIAGPGSTFHHWEVTSGLTVLNPLAASTTVTGANAGTVTAVFVQTSTFESIAAEDGRTRESAAHSGVGGSFNSNANDVWALRAGDDWTDRYFKSVLSFDTTSIPSGSTIVAARIELTGGVVTGFPTVPPSLALACNVSNTSFGTSLDPSTGVPLIENADYEATGSSTSIGGQLALTSVPLTNYVVPLDANGRSQILFGVTPGPNVRTQVKLFLTGTAALDAATDLLGFYSGDSGSGQRPRLVVEFY
ncbi:MAG: hypothetical protein K8S98_10375 [Planctomycetes bacterium]|nr:hypothetical protein [Planctomycetota bacterium]